MTPANIAMEPTARTCRWRAAAHRARYTDMSVSLFSSGLVGTRVQWRIRVCSWFWSERTALLRTSGQFAASRCPLRRVGVFGGSGARGLRRTGYFAALGLPQRQGCSSGAPLSDRSETQVPRTFCRCRGSFAGPYNIRLHLTAPRERCSHAVRSESPVIE